MENSKNKMDNVDWNNLACNSNPIAIDIIEKNLDKIDNDGWEAISSNHGAINIIKKNMDKICLICLAKNTNPEAIQTFRRKGSRNNIL
jgi:hypothetical protein